MIAAPTPRRRPRAYQTHGLYRAKAAVKALGSRAIDRRTRVGKALVAWRLEIAGDLGGLEALSAQQRAVLDQAVTLRLLLDSIDAWLLAQPALVDRRKRALLPVVRERQALADALVRYLTTLGLERRARDVDLHTYLATRQGAAPAPARAPGGAGAGGGQGSRPGAAP
jgi:hypothetical protein